MRVRGWSPCTQWFQSPTTEMRWAAGAHTAKATPSVSPMAAHVGAEVPVEAEVATLGDQVEVELAEEAGGVVPGGGHAGSSPSRRRRPSTGTSTQSGRWASS